MVRHTLKSCSICCKIFKVWDHLRIISHRRTFCLYLLSNITPKHVLLKWSKEIKYLLRYFPSREFGSSRFYFPFQKKSPYIIASIKFTLYICQKINYKIFAIRQYNDSLHFTFCNAEELETAYLVWWFKICSRVFHFSFAFYSKSYAIESAGLLCCLKMSRIYQVQ